MNAQQRIDHWTLELHQQVATRLLSEPHLTEKLRQHVQRQATREPHARSAALLTEWQQLLAQPAVELGLRMCEQSERGAELRSVSPIGMLISQVQRQQAMRRAGAL